MPDELRVVRAALGFDYGKFDFVLRNGKPILLDVNRTPTVPPNLSEVVRAQQGALAKGLDSLLARSR